MYLVHKDLSEYWAIDIEANGLLPDTIFCVVCKNVGTKEKYCFTNTAGYGRSVKDFPAWYNSLSNNTQIVGHNVLSYDLPNLTRLLGLKWSLARIVDTLVLSYLYNSAINGGHSLEAWGERLKKLKLPHDDWAKFSPEMLERCEQDVDITIELFLRLTARMRGYGYSEKSCEIEHYIRDVINEQERNGFYFDTVGARALYSKLRSEQDQLNENIERLFPPVLTEQARFKYRLRANGQPYARYAEHCRIFPRVDRVGEEYVCYDWQKFNIASPAQRIVKLTNLGWEPTSFTPKGNPKVDEDVLIEFAEKSGIKEVQAIADWLVLAGRSSMLQTWLVNVDLDNCIHGHILTCGATTRRMIHFKPNTANIPKAKKNVKYGYECRSLWQARPGRVLVGYDAASLEMRMMLHYLKADQKLIDLYLSGDPHQANSMALEANPWGWEVPRDTGAKNGFYAFIYGAQDSKLGWTFNHKGGKEFGAWGRQKLYEITPGLEDLITETQHEYYSNNGMLKCIDGGFNRCPSPHAAVNYRFQGAGAIVMKQAAIYLRDRASNLDHLKVGDIHDEGQHDVYPLDADKFGQLAVQCIRDAGEELNFNLPLDGNYKIGPTWASTH